ncbi:3557_t:CDS:2 [Funneliformis mosseae]|uniref:tyrosinase n=1 Tax=Funneliformis mosseae TaxID=27381 RepID=A0A9N9CE55_FUNMO|nr:3557_t:CDS:2 [Funneliformis mosseae]
MAFCDKLGESLSEYVNYLALEEDMEDLLSHVSIRSLPIKSKKEHVIVKPFDTVQVRLPIEVLMSNSNYKKQKDLFLQGFAAVQQRDADDPRSFCAVAGIHGLPYKPYDLFHDEQEPSTDYHGEKHRWGGYCHHGDILFPTWHRPYVLLLEMLIYDAAEEMINNNPDIYRPGDKETEEYKQELEKLRFPYWDWASPSTLVQGLPSVLTDEYVLVDNPVRKKIKIRNPLRAFTLPVNLGTLSLVGDIANPTQRPYIPEGNVTPYTPAGYATTRHPSINYISNVDKTSLNVVTFCSSVFRPTLYQALLVKDWRHFSNHGDKYSEEFDEDYGHYSSIEVVHDALHDAIGGIGGHMSYPDVSGFDPIFFLHHCNVDRLIAIWQACHPDAWIVGNAVTEGTFTDKPDAPIDENTYLTPFRKTDDKYWTSKDVRNIADLGYTYPELECEITHPKIFLFEMLKYYHPNRFLRYHWQLNLIVKKFQVGSPFQIRVFLDKPDASASTPLSSPNFAGLLSIFARGRETYCGNCNAHPDLNVKGHVDLTLCMKRLSIDLNPEKAADTPSLLAKQIKIIAVSKDGSEISLHDAGLIFAYYVVVDEFSDHPLEWKEIYRNIVYPPKIRDSE